MRSATLARDPDAPGAGIPGVPERFLARVRLSAPGGEEVVNAQLRSAVENRLMGLPAIARAEVTMEAALFRIL